MLPRHRTSARGPWLTLLGLWLLTLNRPAADAQTAPAPPAELEPPAPAATSTSDGTAPTSDAVNTSPAAAASDGTTPAADATTTPTAAAEPATLEFKFREQKWIDVLDWFSRQADLSLVVNELPPGTFTYSDTRSYTPNEALDLLNGVLGSRGFALVRRERMLVCANLSQGVPDGLIPHVALENLDKYGQFELVEVTFPLGRRPVAAVSAEITPLLGKYGKATPLAQTNQLIVVTSAGTMRAVDAIISSIPEPPAPKPQPPQPPPQPPALQVYPLQRVDAQAAQEILRALLADVKIAFDPRAGQLDVYATPDQHEVVTRVLEQMASTATDELKPKLELYDVAPEAAATLLGQLRLIVPTATLSLDTDGRRILAFATPGQQAEIVATMQKLQVDASDPNHQQIVVYSLRHADPTTVSTMLQSLLPRAKITVDAATKRLVVLAHADQQTTARQFVEQLEATPPEQPVVNYVELEHAQWPAVQALAQQLVPLAKLTFDREKQQLMVVATPADQNRVQQLLQQLAAAPAKTPERTMRRYDVTISEREQFQRNYRQLAPQLVDIQLLDAGSPTQLLILGTDAEHERVAAVLEQVKTQFPEVPRTMHFYAADADLKSRFERLRNQLAPELGQIQVIDDANDPRLGIVATAAQHHQIELLLNELSRELPKVQEQLRIFPVTPTQRTRFTALQPSLAAKLGTVRIIDEAKPEELVVWGTTAQLETIAQILPTLQSAERDVPLELVAYPLREGDPATVQKVLKELYPDVKTIIDTESRRVMVWTTAEQQRAIEQAVQQLDAPATAGKQRMAYYRLVEVDAKDLQPMLQNLVPKMTMSVDRERNSIVAWGSDKDHAALGKMVDDVRKQQTATAPQVVSYPTGSLEPQRLRRLLEDLVPRARLVADDANRQLVVWATPDDHRTIEQALQEAARATGRGDATLESYRISRIAATNAVTLLTDIVPGVKVTPSTDGSKLLIWANAAQHTTIRQAIEQIEAGAANDQPALARSYRGEPAVIKQVEQLLPSIAPGAKPLTDTQAGLLVLWATETEHAAVAQQLEAIGSATTTPTTELVTHRLQRAKPAQARELIQATAPDAKFLTTDDPLQLLIQATSADHALIRKTLEQLEQAVGAPESQTVQVYPLGKSLPSAITPLLPPELLLGVTIVPDAQRNALIVRATAARQAEISAALTTLLKDLPEERRRVTQVYHLNHATPATLLTTLTPLVPTATLAVDAETSSLVATAFPEDQVQIQTAVTQLDQPQTNARQTRVFRLPGRDLFGLRSALQTLVPAATVAADRNSRLLLVAASAQDLQRVEAAMKQLDQVAVHDERQTKVYRLTSANVDAAEEALAALLPLANVRGDDQNHAVLVTADAADQARAADVIAQLDQAPLSDLRAQAYALKSADVRAARDAIQSLLPSATVSADFNNRTLVVTCRATEQERVAEVIAQLDQPNAAGKQTHVYRLRFGDVRAVASALEELLPRGTIAADPKNRALVVTGTAAEHERVRATVEQFDTARQDPTETRVYALERGDAVATQRALEALLPDAVFANDPTRRTLIATATPADHERIGVTVKEMDRAGAQEPTLHAYSVTKANLTTVFNSLKSMYERNASVTLTSDENSHSILAKAAPADQQTIAQVVAQMENSAAAGDGRSLVVYDVGVGKQDTLLPTLQKLFEKQTPAVDLSLNTESKQLIAVATATQHALLANAVERMQREPMSVEVFPLQSADPYAIETAISQLYQADANKPITNGDSEFQQLFVRGTRQQIDEVRQLLAKMGELPLDQRAGQRGMRVVPVRGDLNRAIEQLRDVWPKLRQNPLHVVQPPDSSPSRDRTPSIEQREPGDESVPWPDNLRGTEDTDSPSVEPDQSQLTPDFTTRLVAQDSPADTTSPSVRPEPREEPRESTTVNSPAPPAPNLANEANTTEPAVTDPILTEPAADEANHASPLVIIPHDHSLTLLSDDDAALSQAEALLRTLARQDLHDSGAGNFAVYTLRNAGARAVAKLLTDLFQQMPLSTRAMTGKVVMVADDRLNAVVVHGRAADRNVIAELLQVLDSANVPDSLANARPKIVPVRYLEATRIRTILQGVYQTQLKSGATRPEIDIPRGISTEVATLLRQINASSSGPLLTLEIDDVTNSIVVLAPPQLSSEVAALIRQLDANAQANDARDIGIVTLRGANVKQLKPALDELLRPSSRRRRSP